MIVVFSPHLDDAVLSVGAFLSWQDSAHVVTMFAGDPDARSPVTGWDSACGFASGRHAMEVRRAEDKRACGYLHATIQHVPLLDGQYRHEEPYTFGVLESTVSAVIRELEPNVVLAPLGIVHTDHVAVGAAVRHALAEWPGQILLYEELPYRVDDPGAAVHTLDGLEDVTWYSPAAPDLEVAVRDKARALAFYTSQLWAVPRWALYVPERMWEWREQWRLSWLRESSASPEESSSDG